MWFTVSQTLRNTVSYSQGREICGDTFFWHNNNDLKKNIVTSMEMGTNENHYGKISEQQTI